MSNQDIKFIHLRTRSAYSLSRGAIKIEQIINFCKDDSMPAICVSDIDSMFGAMEFSLKAQSVGIQPIIGLDIHLLYQENNINQQHQHPTSDIAARILLLVMNEQGYQNINKLTAVAYMRDDDEMRIDAPFINFDELKQHHDGLILLTGGRDGILSHCLAQGQDELAQRNLTTLYDIFNDRLYIELQRFGIAREKTIEQQLLSLAKKNNIPLVATNDCYYLYQDDFEAHDALLCIHHGHLLSEEDRPRITREQWLKPSDDMCSLFHDLPSALTNSVEIAKRCAFLLEEQAPSLPAYDKSKGQSEQQILRDLSQQGLKLRLEHHFKQENISNNDEQQKISAQYEERLDYELNTIIEMGFAGYFLIVADFIQWAKSQDIPVGPGRGSGAGSLVAWALTITDLDPIKWGLLFERFLNPERVSMPDFDIDFCQDRRDEVFEYIQRTYGNDHVAQIITIGTFKARQILRDIGRVLQYPLGMVDRICKMVPNNPAKPVTINEALEQEKILRDEYENNDEARFMIDLSKRLEGLNRHASTHAAGVVIAKTRLDDILPIYRDRRMPIPVTQYNMKYVEKTGLVKFDLLGLKTLTIIQNAINIINKEFLKPTEQHIDISLIDLHDKKSYELYCRADTLGVFQVESSGMKDILKQLRPDRLEDMIAVVALYRPGPMDNIPSFIKRKHGNEKIEYLHPSLEVALKETYGIAVYQEQVMEMARIIAGYSLGGADLLRRAMGKKIASEMAAQRDFFISGAKEQHGINKKQANEIFDQIDAFAGYGFNKSHAAAYALVSYQTAWLKAHYPIAFYCASMSLDLNNTDRLAIFRSDAQQNNITIIPPCINQSDTYFTPAKTDGSREFNAINYALAAIRNTGTKAMEMIVAERTQNGDFKDIFDFVTRIDASALNKRILENLIAAGAFDSLHDNRQQLYRSVETLLQYANESANQRNSGQSSFFDSNILDTPLPKLYDCVAWEQHTALEYEMKSIGFFLSDHPLSDFNEILHAHKVVPSNEIELLDTSKNPQFIKIAGIPAGIRQIRTKNGKKMAFLTLSDQYGQYDISFFSEKLEQWRDMLSQKLPILIDCNAAYNDTENRWRLSPHDIKLLDKNEKVTTTKTTAKETIKPPIDKIELIANEDCDFAYLAQLLNHHAKATDAQQTTISILLKLCNRDYGHVWVRLSDNININDTLQQSLKKTKGIEKINMIEKKLDNDKEFSYGQAS